MLVQTAASKKMALLEKLPLFGARSRSEVARISRLVDELEVPAWKRPATVGDTGRGMFIIVAGRALVARAPVVSPIGEEMDDRMRWGSSRSGG